MFDKRILEYLACPICKKHPLTLEYIGENRFLRCNSCSRKYIFKKNIPVLLPEGIFRPDSNFLSHEKKYWQIWMGKQNTSEQYHDHITKSQDFIKWFDYLTSNFNDFAGVISGDILDIGCGRPEDSLKYFSMSSSSYYIGIDPYIAVSDIEVPFIQGVAEYLPIKTSGIDNVLFLTVLDHFVDPIGALKEAKRVVRGDGRIFLVNLIWKSKFSLDNDEYHFRHFSKKDIFDYCEKVKLTIKRQKYIDWKEDYRDVGFFVLEPK